MARAGSFVKPDLTSIGESVSSKVDKTIVHHMRFSFTNIL